MYGYNKEQKRITFKDEPITTREVVGHLNEMYQALSICAESWAIISDGLAFMDGVFLGARAARETPDEAPLADDADREVVPPLRPEGTDD